MTVLQETDSLKKTPLYDRHVALQGKIVNFGGWALPVYYTSILAEHNATRESCSFFDVSHLGEIRVQGAGAFDFLQARLTNDLGKLSDGRILYNLLCDERGGLLDDILVYQENRQDYYLIVNAANIASDLEALKRYAPDSVTLTDKSDQTACVAVQGPKAEAILEKLFGFSLKEMDYYTFKTENFKDAPVWISRSGYTGEDGFEIFSSNEQALPIWDRLIGEGKALGAMPAGLGARNTLRLEAGNALYGNDIDQTTSPIEAGLNFAVALSKGGFVGRDCLLEQKEHGVGRKLSGFKMLDKAIAREHYAVFKDGKKIGMVTSGSYAPTVKGNIGLAYISKGNEKPGTPIEIEIHGRLVPAEIVQRPFVALKHKKALSQQSNEKKGGV